MMTSPGFGSDQHKYHFVHSIMKVILKFSIIALTQAQPYWDR